MAKNVVKDQTSKEKLVILLEVLGHDVDKFKFEKYKENKKDPLLCKKLSGSYAEMCKAQTMATVTTLEDYDMINPFYYNLEWKNKIQYIEDVKSKHITTSTNGKASSFKELHSLSASDDTKQTILRNMFDIWVREHESDMEIRKHYYDTIIDSIDNRKLKGSLLKVRDILYIIFFVFAILTVTNPTAIPSFFGILPFFQNTAVNINQSMITSTVRTSIIIVSIYLLAFGIIASIFFGQTKKEYYNTFKNKKKSKKRFERAIQVSEIKQTAAIKSYIVNFVNSSECPKTQIKDIVLVQNTINNYDYYYSEMRSRYGWMEQHGGIVSFILSKIRLVAVIIIVLMFGLL